MHLKDIEFLFLQIERFNTTRIFKCLNLPAKSNARTNEVHIFVRKPQSRQTTAIVPAVILALPEMVTLCNRDERMRTLLHTETTLPS